MADKVGQDFQQDSRVEPSTRLASAGRQQRRQQQKDRAAGRVDRRIMRSPRDELGGRRQAR